MGKIIVSYTLFSGNTNGPSLDMKSNITLVLYFSFTGSVRNKNLLITRHPPNGIVFWQPEIRQLLLSFDISISIKS